MFIPGIRQFFTAVGIVFCLLMTSNELWAQMRAPEPELKAAIIINMALFVDWPTLSSLPADKLAICFLDESPVATALAKAQGKNLRNRAEKHGREFDLTEAFLQALLDPMTCAVTGIKLTYDWNGEGRTNPWAPSVDRIESTGGYTMDNVRVVCWAYNMAKNDWADDVVLALASAIVEAADANR